MGRRLLERDDELSALAAAAREAAAGRGSVVLVHGEAGIGKTSLVTALRAQQPAEGRVLLGTCDALSTPPPLGPLRDLAPSVGSRLAGSLRDGDRDRVIAALIDELRDGPATTLVVEDVHWADEATVDTLRVLSRRLDLLPVVLVLTYRDDEVARDHPLRQLLGDLGRRDGVRRLALQRLSPGAVQSLTADSALDHERVWALTDGNPYFVTELVASADSDEVPPTVVDAVLGRLRRLPRDEQDLVEQLAVIPSAVDHGVLELLATGGLRRLAGAEEGGLLVVDPGRVRFRHELTRRAVVDALPSSRSIGLHRRALTALESTGTVEPGRLVHHAVAAGDVGAVVRHAPVAAADSAASGAHREAAAHYAAALEHAHHFSQARQAELWEGRAVECYTVGRTDVAVEAQTRAVALREQDAEPTRLGASLRWLSRMQWIAGDRAAADRSGSDATRVLEGADDEGLLALALSNQAQLAMLAFDADAAVTLSRRAIDIARRIGDPYVLSHALNNLGTSLMCRGEEGADQLLESARIALAADDMENVSRAYVNLVWQLLEQVRLREADHYLSEALELAERREFVWSLDYLHAEQARLELARGHWDAAVDLARLALDAHAQARCVGLAVIATVRVRRGEAAEDELARAVAAAEALGELQRTGPVAALRAEAALLSGDTEKAAALARPAYEEAVRLGDQALIAELGCRLVEAGAAVDADAGDHPFAIQAAGRWAEAAAAWEAAGCPYHQAAALSASPHQDDLLVALRLLDELGAQPLARAVRATLRERGAQRVPRGPLAITRSNPAGLTDRQVDVLLLLAQGLTNAAIADRLVVSVRTVDSHVAAVLAKLGVTTRQAAVERAAELGVADLGSRDVRSR